MPTHQLLRNEQLIATGGAATRLPPPWLSILLPVYNVAAYLEACIASIVPQLPATGVEVLLLDDGSTDGSRAMCERLCARWPGRLRLLKHTHNQGLSVARNNLLEAASGRYVWFVDSDDEMLPGALASLAKVAAAHAPDVVLCDYRRRGRDLTSFIGPTQTLSTDCEALVRGIFARGRMHVWTKIMRRELWGQDLRFPAGRSFEDVMTTPWLCLRARSFFHVPEPWISYRVREGSIMAQVSRTPGCFDARQNDDLAFALHGFKHDAHRKLPGMSALTSHHIGAFCARKFTQIGWRLVRACFVSDGFQATARRLRRYLAITESCSPTPFAQVARHHLREGRMGRWMELQLLMAFARRSPEAA